MGKRALTEEAVCLGICSAGWVRERRGSRVNERSRKNCHCTSAEKSTVRLSFDLFLFYDHSECKHHSCRTASRPAEPCLPADSTGELMSYLQIPLGLFWTDGECNTMQSIPRVWERIAVGILSLCYL